MSTSIYLSFLPCVNNKIGLSTSSFLILLLKVEYAIVNSIGSKMCFALSINKKLQNLENKKIIKKHHRIAYLDLLTHDDTFEPFKITHELLQSILGLSRAAIKQILKILATVGLLKKSYGTQRNGDRDIPNSLTIQLVHPQAIAPFAPLTLNDLVSSTLTFSARFQGIDTGQGYHGEWKHVWVNDIYNDDHQLTMKCFMLNDLTEEEMTFFESLEKGHFLLFEAKIESFDEKDSRKIRMLKNPTNIRSAYQ